MLPAVLVGVAAAAILVVFGVRPLDLLRFAAYEAGFVLIPGWAVYLALKPSPPGLLRQIAAGWALGYVLEILAYAATAALGIRTWFAAYPVLVLLGAAPLAWHRHGRRLWTAPRPVQGTGWLWALAAACVAVLVYLGIGFFSQTPLPGTVPAVSYYPDLVWDLALAGEALHHWPIMDPNVAGASFSYYTFTHIHLAAVSQVTGLDLPLLLFRLYVPALILLLTLQLYLLGRTLAGSRSAGLLTVLLVLFAGEIDPFVGRQSLFLNAFFPDLYLSPTFLLGLVLFLPLVLELADVMRSTPATRPGLGSWIAAGLFLIGCGGAKGTILPVIVSALGLTLAWRWLSDRRINRPAVIAFSMAALALGGFYLFSYAGSGITPELRPLSALLGMGAIGSRLRLALSGGWQQYGTVALLVVAAFFGLMGLRAVGLTSLAWARRPHFSGDSIWLWSLFLVTLVPYYFLDQPGASQLYFFWFGYVAASALAAEGLALLARRCRSLPLLPRTLVALPLVALLATQLLDTPLDSAATLGRWRAGLPAYAETNRNLTQGLLAGLDWLRQNTGTGAVLAVNNYYSSDQGKDPRYYYYAAFAQRRVFLEGWLYTNQSHKIGYSSVAAGTLLPFPERYDLNQRVFLSGDPAALSQMASRYGVSYLVVDRVHGSQEGASHLADEGLITLAFENQDVQVYAVRSTAPGDSAGGAPVIRCCPSWS